MDKLRQLVTNPKGLLVAAVLLVLLNLVDGGLSFWLITVAKVAYEANPLMAALIGVSPYLFLAFKVLVPTFAATIFYKYREYPFRGIKITPWVLWFSCLIYIGLMVHFGFLLHTAVSAGLL